MDHRRSGKCFLRTAGTAWRVLAPLALLLWSVQLQALPAEPKPGCADLLTPSELSAISPGAEEMGANARGDGHSECSWSVRGGGGATTLTLTFWKASGMADALVPADSPEEFFEIYVKSAEQVRGTPREALKGVGLRSALFRDGALRELYVLTRTGVAHLLTDGLNDAQIAAVGKAVGSGTP